MKKRKFAEKRWWEYEHLPDILLIIALLVIGAAIAYMEYVARME